MTIPKEKTRKSVVFPATLYEKIRQRAAQEYRSISGLICYVMEKYLEEKKH